MAHSSLAGLFSDIADAIRAKTGSSAAIVADNFPTEIANIPTGGGGIDVSDTTAVAGDVKTGKYFYTAEGVKTEGTIATVTHPNPTLSRSGAVITAQHVQSTGYVAGGTTSDTLTLDSQAAATFNPTTSEQTIISANTFCTGAIKVGKIPNQATGGAKYATTSAQTLVTAPKYITTNITLGALSHTNLTAANIKDGVTVTVNNGNTNVWSVTGTAPTRYAYEATLAATSKKSFNCNSNTGVTSIQLYYVTFNPGFIPTTILCVCNSETLWRASYIADMNTYVLVNESGNYYACSSGWTVTASSCLIPCTPTVGLSFYVKAWR